MSARALLALGAAAAPNEESPGAPAAVWQRVRGPRQMRPRWAKRHLLLAHNLLYTFRTPEVSLDTDSPR